MGLILAQFQIFLLSYSETFISMSDTNLYIQQVFTLFTFLLRINFIKKIDDITFV